MKLEHNYSMNSFVAENKGVLSSKIDSNHNETSRQNAEEVHNSFRDFKKGWHTHSSRDVAPAEKLFVDLNFNQSMDKLEVKDEEQKKQNTYDSLLSSRIDKDDG